MAGTYNIGEHKDLSGVYSKIIAALEAVSTGARGIVAYPFTADWGPVNTIQEIYFQPDFYTLYNAGVEAHTASKINNHAFRGKPSLILAYRMATANAAKGVATLNDSLAAKSLELETLYPSARAFTATVTDSLSGGKVVTISEGGRVLASVQGVTLADLEAELNKTDYVRVKSKGTQLPANTAGASFSGGNDGEVVTATEYAAFRTEVEADGRAKALALDDYTDAAEVTATETWLKRVRDEGLYVTFVNGGPSTWDTDIASANTASTGFNYRGIINVGNGVDGYTAGDLAIFIAARAASVALNRTLTDEAIPYDLVNKKLTRSARITAKKAGTLVFIQNGDNVEIDEAVNTLTTPGADEVVEFGKIRVSNALDQIAADLEVFGNEYKKTRSNTPEARETYAATVEETYYGPLITQQVLQAGATYRPDPEYHGTNPAYTAKIDEAYFVSTIQPVDSMEKIYQKFGVSFN